MHQNSEFVIVQVLRRLSSMFSVVNCSGFWTLDGSMCSTAASRPRGINSYRQKEAFCVNTKPVVVGVSRRKMLEFYQRLWCCYHSFSVVIQCGTVERFQFESFSSILFNSFKKFRLLGIAIARFIISFESRNIVDICAIEMILAGDFLATNSVAI